MCGRYDLNAMAQALAERFGVPTRELSVPLNVPATAGTAGLSTRANSGWQPRYNIAPQQHNPVIVGACDGQGGQNQLELMRWGLVPAWSKESQVAYSTINARAETVASKPTFRKSLSSRRCLVPATGYFEWVESTQQGKQPYRIQLRNAASNGVEGIFAFAGLYDIWQGPGGEELHSYTIVTTKANDALSAIHSRMPVILPRDFEGAWLDPDNSDAENLVSMLQPYPQERMIAYPVSRLVNSPTNEGRQLIDPLYARSAVEGQRAA
ncbi:MAG TPA: SOS response-associated peptidase [Chloroflexia bacterium]|nr:SOS response-associated peptidase [Chloroflexia bacterium]